MTLLELAQRAEKAGPDEQRELLVGAFVRINGIERAANEFWRNATEYSFRAKLDAEAYLDAAMMLLPEDDWEWVLEREMTELYHPRPSPVTYRVSLGQYGKAESGLLPMALLAAICRATAETDDAA